MKLKVCVIFLWMFSFAVQAAPVANIVFRPNHLMTVDNYLVLLRGKIPLKQYELNSARDVVRVDGSLILDLRQLAVPMQVSLEQALEDLVSGRREVSGVWFDFKDADVRIYSAAHPEPIAAVVAAVVPAQVTAASPTIPKSMRRDGVYSDELPPIYLPWGHDCERNLWERPK